MLDRVVAIVVAIDAALTSLLSISTWKCTHYFYLDLDWTFCFRGSVGSRVYAIVRVVGPVRLLR